MSGSRLGRGRGGRLAVYGGCGVVVVLLVILYRAASSEMARLRELHVQCAHQQEALAAQLQVIFEYKVRLEKSLAEEKISNTREKLLRNKDTVEANQRFNSLQQTHKILLTRHQDLQEECKKRETQVMEDTNKLEATLKEFRSRIKQARVDKEAFEHLKNEFLQQDTQKTQLEKKYAELLKANGNTDSTIQHLRKEVIQLKRELEETKKTACKATSPGPSIPNPLPAQPVEAQMKPGEPGQEVQPVGPSYQQPQSTVATSSMKSIPALKLETSTPASSGNPASTAVDKALAVAKPASKVKLPVGVLPIPVMIDQKLENREEKQNEVAKKKEEPKQRNSVDSKEQEIENENLDLPLPAIPARRVEDQLPDRRGGNGWFNVGPGVQEIGEELNHIRLPGLDVGAERNADAGDDHYDGVEYDKDPQQKNSDLQLVEGEDVEDEDDQID
ncbi:Golgi integral membrane protein 4 [Habropoda laboriosa]|uniref:Golgi integral membrane protein 4 n=1 Tax=Habropoda laboriosa TaxID=597456 RepID=A0A0L7RAY2_9HYME|nr:PREDICTED: Golgi integral membrane protein 4-like [Habropoda laboriosa]KOC67896.1 Golgi integral membrane protein 4 [Habropoda laboriosa]